MRYLLREAAPRWSHDVRPPAVSGGVGASVAVGRRAVYCRRYGVRIRMPSQPPGAKPPDSRGAFGSRQDQDPRACDRGVRRMLTRMAHQPVDNSILHGMRRFARRSWRSAKRAQAHATRPHRFRQHRTQHRTHPFRHPTHPSVRTHPATIPFPPAKPNQLRGIINNLHAHTSHPSHPL